MLGAQGLHLLLGWCASCHTLTSLSTCMALFVPSMQHLILSAPACALCVQSLVLDDNRANAAMALAFNNTACTYRFQQPQAFYECRLVQLQWWRAHNSLRCATCRPSNVA
jgi:hypothetical protein